MRQLVIVFLLLLVLPLSAQEEVIKNFATNLEVLPDGSVEVTEDVTVVATGDKIERGLTRALHRRGLGDDEGRNKRFSYSVLEVQRNGETISHFAKNEGRNRVVYLGSKNKKISPGEYTFRLKYRSEGQIYFLGDRDEIRWPLVGVDGVLPTEKASITVSFPAGTTLKESACYTGREDETAEDCSFTQGTNATTFTLTRRLAAGEGMTVAVGIAKGAFIQPAAPPPPPPPTPLEEKGTLYFSLFGILAALWYGYTSWQKYGVDPEGPEIRPQFAIPEGISPAGAAYLLNPLLGGQHGVISSLTDLSIKDYVAIKEEETSQFLGLGSKEVFVLERTGRAERADIYPEQHAILKKLSPAFHRIVLDGKYNAELNAITQAHDKAVSKTYKDMFSEEGNGSKTWPLVGICVAAIVGAAFFLKTTSTIGLWAFILLVIGSLVGIGLYLWLIRKPSPEKVAMRNRLKGLRNYLKMKESKRRQLLNAPEMDEAHFQELLPYAIAFGLQNNWAADLAADWANTADRPGRSNHHLLYTPSFGRQFGTAFNGTAHQASSSSGGGGGFSGGGGSVGGGGGTGGF